MKRLLPLFLLILALCGSVCLQAAFRGLFIPHAKAYFSNGDTLTAHFFFNMDDIADYHYQQKGIYEDDEETRSGYKTGDDLLPLIKGAYTHYNHPLWYATEIIRTPYGIFNVTDSQDTLRVTALDSLIFIDVQLEAYLACPEVTRRQAEMLKKQAISTQSAEGSLTDYLLVNTNPDITWQELLIYASQYNDDPTRGTRLSWYRPTDKQDSLQYYLLDQYQTKGTKALPELISWTGKALAALQTLPPCLDKMTAFSSEQKQQLADSLAIFIQRCSKLQEQLSHLKNSQEVVLKQIMTAERDSGNYFDIIFPLLPVVGFNVDFADDFLADKGIVVLAWQWD